MKVTVQVVIEPEDGPAVVTEVATLEREALTDATLGLTLAESKMILAQLQETMVAQQAALYSAAQQTCPTCGARAPAQGAAPDRGALAVRHAPAGQPTLPALRLSAS